VALRGVLELWWSVLQGTAQVRVWHAMLSQFIERLDFYPARLKNTFVDRQGAGTRVDPCSMTGVSGPGRSFLSLDPHGLDLNRRKSLEGATPRHQFGLRSFHDLPAGLQHDAQLRDLAAIETLPDIVSSEGIPGYTELDVRLGWRGWKETEISLAGQNLLHPHHAEFGAPATRGEIARGIFGKIAWNY